MVNDNYNVANALPEVLFVSYALICQTHPHSDMYVPAASLEWLQDDPDA